MPELIERLKRVADNKTLMQERGELVDELRDRDFSWRQIEEAAGTPHANVRRWLKRYQDEDTQE